MSPADVELAKALTKAGFELISMAAEWFQTGQRPKPKRVEEVWSKLAQETAKHETDAAERARWPKT
jgi:hypothetical protein